MIEHADAAAARFGMPLEREIHFLDAVTLRAVAERRLGAGRRAAEQDEVGLVHFFFRSFVLFDVFIPFVSFAVFVVFVVFVPFISSARSMILANMAPVSPP